MIVGASTEISKDNFGELICTRDNVKNIEITRKYVKLGLFSQNVLVDFDITIETNGKKVDTTGYLNLSYDINKKTKWRIDVQMLRNKNVRIYE